jgi:hypothetical protein
LKHEHSDKDLLNEAEGIYDEFLIDRLMDFLRRIGIDRAQQLQDGIHSGMTISAQDFKRPGVFFLYRARQAGKATSLMRFYDLTSDEIIRQDLSLLKMIECDEKTGGIKRRYIPDDLKFDGPRMKNIFQKVEERLQDELRYETVRTEFAPRIDRVQTAIRDIIDEDMASLNDEQKLEWQSGLRAKLLLPPPEVHVLALQKAKREHMKRHNTSSLLNAVSGQLSTFVPVIKERSMHDIKLESVCFEVLA